MNGDIHKIIRVTSALNDFWSNCEGWAPENASGLLYEARLDRQLSFAYTLIDCVDPFPEEVKDAKIIMGYAALRSMSEGAIKLFFSAFAEDYLTDSLAIVKKNKIVSPEGIGFDDLIKLYLMKGDPSFEGYLRRIQYRGNAIHHFKDRDIGSQSDLVADIKIYKNFLLAINHQLPYPDEVMDPGDA
jgi:hypothetical protein